MVIMNILLELQITNMHMHPILASWLGSMSERINEIRASTIDVFHTYRVKTSTFDLKSVFSDGCFVQILVSGLEVL